MHREKVIKGLEICNNRIPGKYNCNECPYEIDGNYCEINLTKDALALLKEQEAISVDVCGHISTVKYGCCPKCNEGLNSEVLRSKKKG